MKAIKLYYLTVFMLCCSSITPDYVSWDDNIHNEKNEEYVIETLFNMDSISATDTILVQFTYIERYYCNMQEQSKEWYHKVYDTYGFNP